MVDPTQNVMGGSGGEFQTMRYGAGKFPNPFFDIASEYIPRDLRSIFELCEFVMLTNGSYRAASRRVVRYFLTEILLENESVSERKDCMEFLTDYLHIMRELAEIGDDYQCFHGDTPVPTRDGVFNIRELDGKAVEVLSQAGVYRRAEFKSFGTQELLEVEFSDGRTVLATPEHQWLVRKSTGGLVKVPTTELAGRCIPRTVAPRPPKGEAYREGVRHGFVFGDGSIYNKSRKTPHAVANFFGAKDTAVLPFFAGIGGNPGYAKHSKLCKVHGLPAHYKLLPPNDASAEYWYGFVCGFMAADGSVDVHGCPLLTQACEATLAAIASQLPRIGMVAGPLRTYPTSCDFERADGHIEHFDGQMSYLGLLHRFMREDDFLIESHIAKFASKPQARKYGEFMLVKAVRRTGIVDKVYCCVEPETHTFVIGNGVLTGNCYGNVFVSLYLPFDRVIRCPDCKMDLPLFNATTVRQTKPKFNLAEMKYSGTCPCGYVGEMEFFDRPSKDKKRVKLRRWNPKLMRLRFHHISGRVQYFMEFEPIFVSKIREGNLYYVNETPQEMLECISKTPVGDTAIFEFDPSFLYHLREPTMSGLPIRGWGIPGILANFKLAYYIQVLRRYDEALAFDFIVPFRIIFPNMPKNQNGDDALSLLATSTFNGQMQSMIARHRKDPTTISAVPFPVGYQMVGGEGKQLAPKENIALAVDELLNAVGYPAEMYKGTLALQAAPVALRLFEKTWIHLVDGNNDMIQWMVASICRHFGWAEMKGKMRTVTLADDIERKALLLQAAAGQDISKGTAYKPFGIDFNEEQRKVIDEQQAIQKLQQEAQEEQQTMGSAGEGDQQSPSAGATPGDVYEQGKQLAYQLLTQTPESMRRGELIKIKNSNPTLHAIVLQSMDEYRQEMSRQGGAQMLEQAKSQGAAAAQKAAEFRKWPSEVIMRGIISDQLLDYTRRDLRKIAVDIKYERPCAKAAFHFIASNLGGLIA